MASPQTLRILEIEAELTEMKRVYVAYGIDGDFRRRTALEAERASLSVEREKFRIERERLKQEARETKHRKFMVLLCKKVEDAGMAHLIEEAQYESLDFIKSAGMYDAYTEKGMT